MYSILWVFTFHCRQIVYNKCWSFPKVQASFQPCGLGSQLSCVLSGFLDANGAAHKTTRQLSVWLCVGDSVAYSVWRRLGCGSAVCLIKAAICQIFCSSLCHCPPFLFIYLFLFLGSIFSSDFLMQLFFVFKLQEVQLLLWICWRIFREMLWLVHTVRKDTDVVLCTNLQRIASYLTASLEILTQSVGSL